MCFSFVVYEANDKAARKLNCGQTRKRWGKRGRGDTSRENISEWFSLCSLSLAPSLIVISFDLLIYPLRSTNEKHMNKNKQTNKAKQKPLSAYYAGCPCESWRLELVGCLLHLSSVFRGFPGYSLHAQHLHLRAQNLSSKKG